MDETTCSLKALTKIKLGDLVPVLTVIAGTLKLGGVAVGTASVDLLTHFAAAGGHGIAPMLAKKEVLG